MYLKNTTSGQIVDVCNVGIINGVILGRYEFGSRFYNKYGSMVERVGADGDRPIFKVKAGWEIVSGRQATKAAKSPESAPTPQENTPAEPSPAPAAPAKAEPSPAPAAPAAPAKAEPQPAQPAQPVMPSMDAAAQAFAALTPLFAGVQANVVAQVLADIEPMKKQVQAICDRAPQVITHVIKVADKQTEAKPGQVFHDNFEDVCGMIAEGQWVYLFGPTGSGKNVLAQQIAEALGLDFYYQAHCLDRFELTGFIDAAGNYQPTEFYKAYTMGGLFMLDELDASDENALVTLNSASNGYFAFPNGTVKQHPNFRCIAAGNTCGRGATDDYTGRHVLDISSMGRFRPRLHGYCDAIDRHEAQNNDELVSFIHVLRDAKKKTGAQIIASPRQIKKIVMDESAGRKLSQTLQDLFGTFMTSDEVNIVRRFVMDDERMKDNKYAKAFQKVQAVEY